ncbi:galactarate/glucarate/glycerate transporter GudP [Rhodovastum atsumiense]|uniref:MFS transporter n=1 Tax=Rhodovastum atsumiense TaxID=504468 RepID=A0A5M6IW56_9PROT|nr:MFS transporter [Rhodovastum atsumiense]KAA5612556.1 MFS transporter [Rhodovastum atsumiense]CAH2601359.1 galactarate/glucarate/glycerate transporter GudP [Rhodovastum atsumiense]
MPSDTLAANSIASATAQKTRVRWLIVTMLFVVTVINYADRATLAIAGPVISKDLGLNAAQMGIVFSAFGWAYVIGQLPGGWLLDRYGSKGVYAASLFLWSFFTLCLGFVGFLTGAVAVFTLFALRFLLGLAESPSFPGNSRIVAAWFPKHERATASALFNSAQYFATVIFAPLLGWITHSFGWPWVFGVMGGLGISLALIWLKLVYSPADHPWVNKAEVDYIAAGGGLVHMDDAKAKADPASGAKWDDIRQMFRNRMMVGIFIGQFCINAITYFFITWFPVYLVQARGMSILKAGFVASLPAICGFLGGILGGLMSDWMLRRGYSLSAARKTPIVLGMVTSVSMIICNYTDVQWVVVGLMALAFFGKGIGALGWAVMSDAAPKEITGLAGGVFNMCGNLSSISTPIIIGYIIQTSGSFNGALVFVAANALIAALSYLVIVGEIKRMVLVR